MSEKPTQLALTTPKGTPDQHCSEVARDVLPLAGVAQLSGRDVEVEDGAVVRVLVGHDQPLPALVEL